MCKKQLVYDKLTALDIPFQTMEHPAVFTIEEMHALEFPPNARIAKNLFLRDAKGKRHFLLVVDSEQSVNLKQLENVLNCTKLSFASEERLQKYLGLTKGSVTPFGLLNDTDNHVEVFFDKKLQESDSVGVHPNDNTATVLITFDYLLKFIETSGHQVQIIDLACLA
ncbi:prolyl-tRNA synthetase associated domain-containing protein [Kineothrix sp. MB12-C1]|uniref:prolyl-tRNA synthetase associated domain-containing protein n=1 Tax=Kineothrix sp. MB12-C1 TaxID=3070215 RepID=UPI0027D21B17|nr:prolyl-tRNA synthetase associated domain-containing protein [Kineothrix sp. MB12-C1]WMC92361.1 prolyl-tRNA synthetase associated domain-containing protein [Kineothrix sp. MB12-C1]